MHIKTAAVVLTFATLAGNVVVLSAQASAPLAFDVVSIKPNVSSERGSSNGARPGGWSMINGSIATGFERPTRRNRRNS
jgi:hypothetical protein